MWTALCLDDGDGRRSSTAQGPPYSSYDLDHSGRASGAIGVLFSGCVGILVGSIRDILLPSLILGGWGGIVPVVSITGHQMWSLPSNAL